MFALHCCQGYTTAVRNIYFGLLLVVFLSITSLSGLNAQSPSTIASPLLLAASTPPPVYFLTKGVWLTIRDKTYGFGTGTQLELVEDSGGDSLRVKAGDFEFDVKRSLVANDRAVARQAYETEVAQRQENAQEKAREQEQIKKANKEYLSSLSDEEFFKLYQERLVTKQEHTGPGQQSIERQQQQAVQTGVQQQTINRQEEILFLLGKVHRPGMSVVLPPPQQQAALLKEYLQLQMSRTDLPEQEKQQARDQLRALEQEEQAEERRQAVAQAQQAEQAQAQFNRQRAEQEQQAASQRQADSLNDVRREIEQVRQQLKQLQP